MSTVEGGPPWRYLTTTLHARACTSCGTFPLVMVKLRTLPEVLETPAGRRHTIDVIADAAHLGRTATETAAALGIKRDTVYATCRRYDELITRQEAS